MRRRVPNVQIYQLLLEYVSGRIDRCIRDSIACIRSHPPPSLADFYEDASALTNRGILRADTSSYRAIVARDDRPTDRPTNVVVVVLVLVVVFLLVFVLFFILFPVIFLLDHFSSYLRTVANKMNYLNARKINASI